MVGSKWVVYSNNLGLILLVLGLLFTLTPVSPLGFVLILLGLAELWHEARFKESLFAGALDALDRKRRTLGIGLGLILLATGLFMLLTGSWLSLLFIAAGVIELWFHPDWKAYNVGLGATLLVLAMFLFLTGSWLWPFFAVFGVAELWFAKEEGTEQAM